jgi:hypothetical protein
MNLKDAFLSLTNYFSPKIIGEVNDQFIKVVKIKGDKVPWHNHKHEDELLEFIPNKFRKCSKACILGVYETPSPLYGYC